MNDLIGGDRTKKKGKKKSDAPLVPWHWGDVQEKAFQSIKEAMTTPPVLVFADFQAPFILHTDACIEGLGAVLCQLRDGKEQPIAYANRGLNKSERNYPAYKLEVLALKWAIAEKCHEYLYGAPEFVVFTDNNPLTYVMTIAKLDATGHRWVVALASYKFSIK